ncbi:MAG: FmdB family zinc ribbon protein [Chloroflexota bacterium]|nr:FmdB family zinc ribbon protein [Chloroflexota bacterium]
MPLYEYQCQTCGVRFERRQHMNDEPVKVCPECGGEVHRLIQPVGIVFKGSGFYVTDNRAKSSTSGPASAKKSSKPSGESKPTDESKTAGESKTTGESNTKRE